MTTQKPNESRKDYLLRVTLAFLRDNWEAAHKPRYDQRMVRWWRHGGNIQINCREDGFVYDAVGPLPFRVRQSWLFLRLAFTALWPTGFSFSVKGNRKIPPNDQGEARR